MSTPTINQSIFEVFDHQKLDLLLHLLKHSPELDPVLIFVRQTSDVHTLNTAINNAGILSESIHGNKKPLLRDRALAALRDGNIRCIVITEAIARNLDLAGDASVINYDPLELLPDYFKRVISRSGGEVITFAHPKKHPQIDQIEEILETTLPRRVAEGFHYDAHALKYTYNKKSGKKGTSKKPLQNKKPKLKRKKR